MLWKVVNEWSVRDKALCSAYNCKVDLHTWNQLPRYIPPAVFLNLVDNETKTATTTTMLKHPEVNFRIGEPELRKYMKTVLCRLINIISRGYFLINQ